MAALRKLFTRLFSSASEPQNKSLAITGATIAKPQSHKSIASIVKQSLDGLLLRQFIELILSYAGQSSYSWMMTPYFPAITILDNKIISLATINPIGRWTRIVAAQTVGEGPVRWRILTEFDPTDNIDPTDNSGRMIIGVSSAPAENVQPPGVEWPKMPTDFLISTAATPDIVGDGVRLTIGGVVARAGPFFRSKARQTITLIEVDTKKATMSATFRDVDAKIRDVTISLPPSSIWRPCVVLYGAVSATILRCIDFT